MVTLPAEATPKQKCQVSGGFWDEASQTCISQEDKQRRIEEEKRQQSAEIKSRNIASGQRLTDLSKNVIGILSGQDSPIENIIGDLEKRREESQLQSSLGKTPVTVQEQTESPEDIDKSNAELFPGIQDSVGNQVIRDQETGEPIGIYRNGQFFKMSPQEIQGIAQKEQANLSTGGALSTRENIRQLTLQKLSGQIGQLGDVGTGGSPTDLKQASLTGLTGTIPGIAGGVLGGALLGGKTGALAGIPGIALGVGVGAVGGFLSGFIGNLRAQRGGQISAQSVRQRRFEQNLRLIVSDTNQNPNHAVENIALFNQQLTEIHREYGKLKTDTMSDLNLFTGQDGTPQLARFESFFAPGGANKFLQEEMKRALVDPDPNRVFIMEEDLGDEE